MQSSLNSSVTLTLKTLVPQLDVKAGSAASSTSYTPSLCSSSMWFLPAEGAALWARECCCSSPGGWSREVEDWAGPRGLLRRWRPGSLLTPDRRTSHVFNHFMSELRCSLCLFYCGGFMFLTHLIGAKTGQRHAALRRRISGAGNTKALLILSLTLQQRHRDAKAHRMETGTRYDWKNCWSINHQ